MESGSAREFLKLYQAGFASELPTKVRRDEALNYLTAALNDESLSDEEIAIIKSRIAEVSESDFASDMAGQLLAKLDSELRQRLLKIPVGVLPGLLFNAETVQSRNTETIIVIATGLSYTLFEIASWYVASVPFEGLPPETSETEASLNVFKLTLFHLTQSSRWLPMSRVEPRAPLRRNIIGAFWTNGLNFVLGHEYAHFNLGHLNDSSRLYVAPGGSLPSLNILNRSHEMEFEADLEGAKIALEYSKAMHDGEIMAGTLGIEMLLCILRLSDQLLPPSQAASSHPSGADRLNRFHDWLVKEYGSASLERINSIDRFFDMTARIGREVLDKI